MSTLDVFNSSLKQFNINATATNFVSYDNFSAYDIKLDKNTRVRDIEKFADEISLAIKAPSKPFIRTLHSLGLVRVEYLSPRDSFPQFDNLKANPSADLELPLWLGNHMNGDPLFVDLVQAPHILAAGTTGSGKTTLLHTIIQSLFKWSKHKTNLILVDPKQSEFNNYKNHAQVIHQYDDIVNMLEWNVNVMESMFSLLSQKKNTFPYNIIIIDEFADLILQDRNKKFTDLVCRLAQKGRAAKFNLVMATQRPSAKLITGDIKANFPTRIACRVVSGVDSKVVLDTTGAEKLMGKGDAFLCNNEHHLLRFQIPFTKP